MKSVTLPIKGMNFAGCAPKIEKHLGKVHGITQVEASYVSQTVTVTYDDRIVNDTQLQRLVTDCGFLCGEPWSEQEHPAPVTQAFVMPVIEHADGHRPALATLPTDIHPSHTRGGMEHGRAEAAPARRGMAHIEHDMSNPAMAKAMEADMRLRFFVSLVLTIPIVLYSPLGINLGAGNRGGDADR